MAVTKGQGEERILPALEAGHRLFGENRVQEAKAKWPKLKARFPDIELHLIGPLQSNKAREAVAIFDVIHSLDRSTLAHLLKDEIARANKKMNLFIQVNTGNEPQKAGIAPENAGSFVNKCRELKLSVAGLMCIPPAGKDPMPHFALLRKLGRENGLPYLSMGMSDDFELAVEMGATHVRIGTAIFGARLKV